MLNQFEVIWLDLEKEPECEPNPNYPKGIDLDVSRGKKSCRTELPYPAKRCGIYTIWCRACHISIMCTTAGRPDDPRSIRIPCLPITS